MKRPARPKWACDVQTQPLAHLMICVLVLCTIEAIISPAAAEEASAAVAAEPKLPRDPLQWRYARGGEIEPPEDDARFWDRQLLSHSIGAANYEQMRPVLDKLNAGRPITVAAVGSKPSLLSSWKLDSSSTQT